MFALHASIFLDIFVSSFSEHVAGLLFYVGLKTFHIYYFLHVDMTFPTLVVPHFAVPSVVLLLP